MVGKKRLICEFDFRNSGELSQTHKKCPGPDYIGIRGCVYIQEDDNVALVHTRRATQEGPHNVNRVC